VAVNIVSIKAATMLNNVGASAELIGTLGLTVVVAIGLFFFAHKQGPSILVQSGSSTGGPVNITTVGLALLLPVYTLLGWGGLARPAEETRDQRPAPRRAHRDVPVGDHLRHRRVLRLRHLRDGDPRLDRGDGERHAERDDRGVPGALRLRPGAAAEDHRVRGDLLRAARQRDRGHPDVLLAVPGQDA